MALPPAHRVARYNYPVRAGAFGFSFLVMAALWMERGQFNALEITAAILIFLCYPHIAYYYARVAYDSKGTELINLYVDCALLGVWAAQIEFALWPSTGMLGALCLNNAGHGSLGRLIKGLALFLACAALWGGLSSASFRPETGPLVTSLCAFGILGYASAVGMLVFRQNKDIVRVRATLESSESQFRFLADRVAALVAFIDEKGRILYASAAYQKYFEPFSVAHGANWLDLVHIEDADRAKSFLDLTAGSSTELSERIRLTLPNGAIRGAKIRANPVRIGGIDTRLVMMIAEFER